jgi:hypothetical protein
MQHRERPIETKLAGDLAGFYARGTSVLMPAQILGEALIDFKAAAVLDNGRAYIKSVS